VVNLVDNEDKNGKGLIKKVLEERGCFGDCKDQRATLSRQKGVERLRSQGTDKRVPRENPPLRGGSKTCERPKLSKEMGAWGVHWWTTKYKE